MKLSKTQTGMTQRTLKKLTDLQADALTTFQNYYRRTKENGDRAGSQHFKGKIYGYLEAMRDAELITERERMALAIYYTLD